ncbi:MAG: hypothetical protein ABJL72_16690 [Roseobacter sp.]
MCWASEGGRAWFWAENQNSVDVSGLWDSSIGLYDLSPPPLIRRIADDTAADPIQIIRYPTEKFLFSIDTAGFFATDGNDLREGTSKDNRIEGGPGADAIYGLAGNDLLFGDKGPDRLEGGDGADSLRGGDGKDRLFGGAGDDGIVGGKGTDTLDGGDGDDRLFGGNNSDYLTGWDGNDLLYGGEGEDALWGREGHDTMHGKDGADFIISGNGNDIAFGGAGRDFLSGGRGNDLLDGGDFHDQIYADDGNDTLVGGEGNDELNGLLGNDVLRGGSDDDRLDGGGGHDQLFGGSGRDRLYGEMGQDTLYGGGDDDVFVFENVLESILVVPDVIVDFEGIGIAGGDSIDLSAIDADISSPYPHNDSFTFLGAVTLEEALDFGAGALWVEGFGNQTRLFGSIDDVADIDFALLINDGADVSIDDYTSSDFIV